MLKTPFIITSLCLLLNAAAPAAAGQENGGCAATTTLISETSEPVVFGENGTVRPPAQDGRFVVTGALVVMAGSKLWKVIVNGRPSVQLGTAYASAIPSFSFNWDDLSGWKKVTRRYRFAVDSKLQGRAVDVLYEVAFYHGEIPGPDPALKGAYIANFTIKPIKIDVKWGWELYMETSMADPMNIGSAGKPVALLTSNLLWRYSGPLRRPTVSVNPVNVTGTGTITSQSSEAIPVPLPEQAPGDDKDAAVAWD